MVNFNSPTQLSLLFFGGYVKEIVKEPLLNELGVHLETKSGDNKGQLRYKNVKKEVYIRGLGLKPIPVWKTKKDGIYQTNESVLSQIANRNIESSFGYIEEAVKIAQYMLQLRQLEKLLGTYYKGTEKFVYPDSCVHHQLCHCGYEKDNHVGGGTGTGRLSCTSPNMQNQVG